MPSLKPAVDIINKSTKVFNKSINQPIQGTIKNQKKFKNITFYSLSDGINKIQLTDTCGLFKGKKLKLGEVVKINNYCIQENSKIKEIATNKCTTIEVTGPIDEQDYPFKHKEKKTLKLLRDIPQYKFQSEYLSNLLKFRSLVETSLIKYLSEEGLIKVAPPLITENDCEDGGETFQISTQASKNFFKTSSSKTSDKKLASKLPNLTVSTQLHLEIMAQALQKVYTLTPCFRSEKSQTNRHLCEFWMLEVELGYIDEVKTLCEFSEKMIKSVVQTLLKENKGLEFISEYEPLESNEESQIESLVKRSEVLLNKWRQLFETKWEILEYGDAIKIIQENVKEGKAQFENNNIQWGDELQTEHEKWITSSYFKKPVFVINYPKACKPFYMKQDKDVMNRDIVNNYDLLFPEIGEIIGGSLREDNYSILVEEMKNRNMDVDSLKWYSDLRKNGSIPHGGFGLGFERLIVYLYGLKNIKDAIPFYRSYKSSLKI
ncbi:hypothetical protein QEN19_003376 [Hanseniaspora menglaensis]